MVPAVSFCVFSTVRNFISRFFGMPLALVFALIPLWVPGIVSVSFAETNHTEVYRNDALHLFVYGDNADQNVFWYVPPVKLLERDGRVVYYKRPKAGHTEYYFYVLPYMTEEILNLLASEIPSVQSRTQLRPILLRRLSVNVPQFNIQSSGPQVTDYQFLNVPQLIQFDLDSTRTQDFEFFVENVPGIPMNVLFDYVSERVSQYVSIEMSCKDVFDALQIGVTGRYEFLGAEIESHIYNFLSTQNTNIRSRGDLPLPEILSQTLAECFIPIVAAAPGTPEASQLQRNLNDSLLFSQTLGAQFLFRRDRATANRKFYLHHEQVADSFEVTSIPLMLTMAPPASPAVEASPLPLREALVLSTHNQARPLASGISVGVGDQLLLTAVFGLFAQTAASRDVRQYRWQADWSSTDGYLFYRIATGPWTPLNGRSVISRETLLRGELQFYLDRERIFSALPERFRRSSMAGLVPPLFTFSHTYPQFSVVVTGRNVRLH